MVTDNVPRAVVDRMNKKVQRDEESGCLISLYSVGSHGYAQIGWLDKSAGKTQMRLCHRLAWVEANGPIPDGMTVDHVCKIRKCIELSHLRLLTNFDNARRNKGRDWPLGQCVNGHPDSELRRRGKHIECRICHNADQRYYRKKRNAMKEKNF